MSATVETQRMQALAKANDVRCAVARFKVTLKVCPSQAEAWRLLADVLESRPPWLTRATMYALLAACRRTGPRTARRFLWRLGMHTDVTVGDLSEARLASVVAILRRGSLTTGVRGAELMRDREWST